MDLLFDLGNTRCKIAVHDSASVRIVAALAWDAPDLLAQWHALPLAQPTRVAVAHVTRAHRLDAVRELVAARFGAVPVVVAQSMATCGRLRVAYADPARLGVDRFLALLAASERSVAQLLVGAGTALTLDAIGADGHHHGGLIVPGVQLMRRAMTEAAPNVAWHEGAFAQSFASDTASALESGIWCAMAGAVARAAQRFATDFGSAPVVVLHGGDAAMLATQLDVPAQRDATLVMRGLVRYLECGVAQSAPVSA